MSLGRDLDPYTVECRLLWVCSPSPQRTLAGEWPLSPKTSCGRLFAAVPSAAAFPMLQKGLGSWGWAWPIGDRLSPLFLCTCVLAYMGFGARRIVAQGLQSCVEHLFQADIVFFVTSPFLSLPSDDFWTTSSPGSRFSVHMLCCISHQRQS